MENSDRDRIEALTRNIHSIGRHYGRQSALRDVIYYIERGSIGSTVTTGEVLRFMKNTQAEEEHEWNARAERGAQAVAAESAVQKPAAESVAGEASSGPL